MGLDNPLHLAFIVVLLLLVFGAKRLPEMGRSLGAGMRGFKESINGETTSHHETLTSAEATPTSSPSISHTPVETDRA
jgi:sec-independent protein translocase protein TatA